MTTQSVLNDISVLLFLSSSGTKSHITLQWLTENSSFEDDLWVLFDDDSGECVQFAEANDITFDVVEDPKDPSAQAKKMAEKADGVSYLISAGWGYRIPPDVIDIPDVAALNCHSSYLPDYKGPSVYWVQWAHAEKTGGATVHLMTEEFDEGAIIAQQRFEIGFCDLPNDILHKASIITPGLLLKAILAIEQGCEPSPQGEGRYFPYIRKRYVLIRGVVNHLLRLIGINERWEMKT